MNNDYLNQWNKFLEDKDPEQFLKDPKMWGIAQGTDNKGRLAWLEFIQSYAYNIDRPIKLLEVGFGSNISYQLLKDKKLLPHPLITCYGTDVTDKFLELTSKNNPEIILFKTDGVNIPYSNEFFDIVYTRHTLEHQAGYNLLLKEMLRVTKSHIFINMFIPLNQESNMDTIRCEDKFFHNTYSYEGFKNFCAANSFSLIHEVLLLSEELAEVKKDVWEPYKDQILILERIL